MDNTKWYVIRAVSGKEKKAKESLEFEIKLRNLSDKVEQIVIPMEKSSYMRNGKRVIVEKNYYPGYILVETEPETVKILNDIFKSTNFIVGFLGSNSPQPLRENEVMRILGKMDELSYGKLSNVDVFNIGDNVKVNDGPFKDFNGDIQDVFKDKNRLKINIKVFGRATPIELSFSQVEKTY